MTVRFFQLDVFAEAAYRGNPLAVFPDAGDLTRHQMQTIAGEMNLSETAFVTGCSSDSYSVRIFTPRDELGFAGHPTLGTAWLLRRLGELEADEVRQRSAAGETQVTVRGDVVWFRRGGTASEDLRGHVPDADLKVARAVGLEVDAIGLEPRELGRSVAKLNPAVADAGLAHLMVPVRDLHSLGRVRADPERLADLWPGHGAYCFTAIPAGGVQARGLFPGLGIEEDPATGSAAASLGIYLADRLGPIELEVDQGIEMGRPSKLRVSARLGEVDVGGRCAVIFEGALSTVP